MEKPAQKTTGKRPAFLAILACLTMALAGCGDYEPPDPLEVLKKQLEAERELRLEAEMRAEKATGKGERWGMAAFVLGLAAVAGFVGGTAIGSRAKHHARRP